MCDICGVIGGHDARCPNYEPQKPVCTCDICDLGIYSGDEVVFNMLGDIAHYECIRDTATRELVEWFNGDIKEI